MPVHDLECAMATVDAAGYNWIAFKDILPTHTIHDILLKDLLDEYPNIDFDVMTVAQDPVTKEYCIFLPDMPHLSKNIVTAIELPSSKTSKRDIKSGRCPKNMKMAEDIWLETGGATGQFHVMKLTIYHFDKNIHSRMNVSLAL